MIDNHLRRTPSVARTDAIRDVRKRLVDTLWAKERIEARIAGLRREVSLWRDRVELARRHADAPLRAAAEVRLAHAERSLADSVRDRETLDVHVARLRHDVRSAQGSVPLRTAAAVEPGADGGNPDVRPQEGHTALDWAALARHELDREIDEIRRRAARREEEGRGHR